MLKFLNDDRILKILLLVIVIGNYFFKMSQKIYYKNNVYVLYEIINILIVFLE